MPKRELKEGEEVCQKCKGKGVIINSDKSMMFADYTCTRCGGSGISDWVSNAMQNDKYHDDDMLSSSYAVKTYIDNYNVVANDLSNELESKVAEMIKKEVKKQILAEITRLSKESEEQNIKQWLISKGVDIDNGIIS
jgi:antitoxin component HigA of HigAB toxin-antitoxin module